jgi:hypothetical protein
MRKNKQLNISIDPDVFTNFEKVAEAEHLSANDLAKLLLSKFGDLRQGSALDALAAIPKDLFKARPGRPPSSPIGTGLSDAHSAA